MAKKNVTYRVFVIKNEELTNDAFDLKDVLRAKLANSNVERRLIPVKDDDDSEKDLLGSFAPASGTGSDTAWIYGVMMRLKPAKEFKKLPDNFEQLTELNETELLELEEIEGKMICSSLYHFLIMGKYLITDLPQIHTISGFQKYINRFLGNRTYGFTPYLIQSDLKLNDIKSVTFKDSLVEEPKSPESRKMSLKRMATTGIKFICPQVKGLKQIMDENMVAATMTINFSCPPKMKADVYARKLSAILAPIQDLDNVYFSLNNGMKLLGSDIVYTHKTILEDDVITPMTYIKSMKKVLQSITV